MHSDRNVRVAVDAMGGDDAPGAAIEGARIATADDPRLSVVLVGPEDVVSGRASEGEGISSAVATQVVGMDDQPAQAVRSRPDSSLAVGCRIVRDGGADAFFSAGNTGAVLAASLFGLGRITGVQRPALATVVPAGDRVPVLLDIGANADCAPEYLVQFAHMGRAYAQAVLGIAEPTVGLLNIGEEKSKGSALALEAHSLMTAEVPGFAGNVEGFDIPSPPVDVIVTDGFTGNVAIKLLEGVAETLFDEIRAALTGSATATLGGLLVRGALRELKGRLDPDRYGGAPLLGIDGVSIVGHGSSSPRAVASGIAVAARAVREDLTGRIARAVA